MNKNSNGSNGSSLEWRGCQQFDKLPSLFALSLRVISGNVRLLEGNLVVEDRVPNKQRRFKWKASYIGEGRWKVDGEEPSSVVHRTSFDHNTSVNYELSQFVRDRLNTFRQDGAFKPKGNGSPPNNGTDPPIEKTKSKEEEPCKATTCVTALSATSPANKDNLPGAVDIAPPLVAVRIPVARIRPNPEQPRKRFRRHTLLELGKSLKEDGQQTPIEVVHVVGDPEADYELIAGERRLRAAQMIGLEFLDAIVKSRKEVPNRDVQHHRCFVADFHREGYSPLETAKALLREKEAGKTVEQLCRICGRSTAWVYQHLVLTELVPELRTLLDQSLPKSKQLSFSVARLLARLPKDKQGGVFQQVSAVKGARLQLIEVKRLVAEIVPSSVTRRGRPRKPSDSVERLGVIIPRMTADALTAVHFSEAVFQSLITTKPGDADTYLRQIGEVLEELRKLKLKIQLARLEKRRADIAQTAPVPH